MSLLTRLVDPQPGEEKLPVHQFQAALAELKRGAPGVTVQTVATAFNLSAGEQTELASFVSTFYTDGINRDLIHDVLLLGEAGHYDLETCEERLVSAPAATDLWPLITHRAFQVVAAGFNNCVLSGSATTAQASPNMTLAVAQGSVVTNDVLRPVTAANVNISAAHATLPRIDLVVIDVNGAKVVRAGTPSSSPAPAALSANDVCLAFVYVKPGDTAIPAGQLLDTRMFRTTGPIIVGKTATPIVRNNTAALQTFVTLTLPANLFAAGRQLRIRAGGNMLLNSGSPTVTLTIAYGGTTMFADVTGAAAADADRLAWTLDVVLIAQAINDQSLSGALLLGPVGARTAPATGIGDIAVPGLLAGIPVPAPIGGSAAVDSGAADRTLTVSFTMSVANANNEIVMEHAFAELI